MMTARREAVDAHGYLHAVASARTLNRVHGYQCTCGAWRPLDEFEAHLDEVGVSTPPSLAMIDRETRARATAAGKIAAGVHHSAAEDLDGFVVCECGLPLTSWVTWGLHFATEVLTGALNEISTR